MVIAMLLVMVSVVICERVAPEMLYQGIGYGGRALVHHHGYDQEPTSVRRDHTPRTCAVAKSWRRPISNMWRTKRSPARRAVLSVRSTPDVDLTHI